MQNTLKILPAFIFIITIIACNRENKNKQIFNKDNNVAIIGTDTVKLQEIDSLASEPIYNIRMQALEVLISQKILSGEAKKQGVQLSELVENKINKFAEKVSEKDIKNYIERENITYIDTASIVQYLTLLKRKQRQEEYTDSLKENIDLQVMMMPANFKEVDTTGIYYHSLNNTKLKNIVYIISDYKCPACRKAEKKLEKIFKKYKNRLEFRFVYFSSYIDKAGLASEAANNQNAFTDMHNKMFETDLFKNENVYLKLAKELDLNIERFTKDINNNDILLKLTKNRELLIKKEIYSTPAFIVNKKLLDGKYAVDYLEKVIENEFN